MSFYTYGICSDMVWYHMVLNGNFTHCAMLIVYLSIYFRDIVSNNKSIHRKYSLFNYRVDSRSFRRDLLVLLCIEAQCVCSVLPLRNDQLDAPCCDSHTLKKGS